MCLTKKRQPEVVVMDIAMPLLNGIGATRQILETLPSTKMIVLSAHGESASVEEVISLGALGWLITQTSASVLPGAIREGQRAHRLLRLRPHGRGGDRAQGQGGV